MFFSKRSTLSHQTAWIAPSNIALVKYWGKHGLQLPKNPSISFTLSNCVTTTAVSFSPNQKKEEPTFEFYFDKMEAPDFHPKIDQFLARIVPYFPALQEHHLKISSHNSFPHSSGIASSASAMAALALCIVDLERQLHPELSEEDFFKKASFLARLGSGSAARSLKGPLTLWGKTSAFSDSSDLYAIPVEAHVHSYIINLYHLVNINKKAGNYCQLKDGTELPISRRRYDKLLQYLNI